MKALVTKCRVCGAKLTEENWYPSLRKKRYYICINCQRTKNAEYYLKNKEKIIKKQREYYKLHPRDRRDESKRYRETHRQQLREKNMKRRERIKKMVLGHYSDGMMICKKCGFDDIRALTLDHIKGGGSRHRRELGRRGYNFYTKLIKDGYPDGYQVLCMNCQFIKIYENNERMK